MIKDPEVVEVRPGVFVVKGVRSVWLDAADAQARETPVLACTTPAPGIAFGDNRPALRAVAGLPPRPRWWERFEAWVWGKLVEMLAKR